MYNTMICSFPAHLDSNLRRSRFQLLRDMEKNQKLLPNTLMIFCHSDVYKWLYQVGSSITAVPLKIFPKNPLKISIQRIFV